MACIIQLLPASARLSGGWRRLLQISRTAEMTASNTEEGVYNLCVKKLVFGILWRKAAMARNEEAIDGG